MHKKEKYMKENLLQPQTKHKNANWDCDREEEEEKSIICIFYSLWKLDFYYLRFFYLFLFYYIPILILCVCVCICTSFPIIETFWNFYVVLIIIL